MAFIDFLLRMKCSVLNERNKYFLSNEDYKQLPFDSKRKRMTKFVKNSSFPTGYILFTKGGAENALLYCDKYINTNDKI